MIPRSTLLRRTLRRCPPHAFAVPRQTSQIRWNATRSDVPPVNPPTPEKTPPSDPKGSLIKLIKDSIKITGPLPVARYMQFCLGHPTQGYYTRNRESSSANGTTAEAPDAARTSVLEHVKTDVFGRKGDFITSPEISQMFGELVGVWFLTQWDAQGRPDKVRIIELGPGRGTLLDDILRTFRAVPSFPITALRSINLVETSEPLRVAQREKLEERIRTFGARAGEVKLEFWNWIGEIPVEKDTFTIVLAHEFFDALPINVFQKTEEGWREVFVTTDPAANTTSGLTLALSREPSTLSDILPGTSPRFDADVPLGGRVEISKDSYEMMRILGRLVSGLEEDAAEGEQSLGGAGLVVDYGKDGFSSNSFRAFRKHEIVHVFDDPGSADLTANVDFAYMKEALAGIATPHGPINQRTFLTALGLAPRLDKLLQAAPTRERKLEIAGAARRLVEEDGMGGEYQFLGITPKRVAEGESGEKDKVGVYPFDLAT